MAKITIAGDAVVITSAMKLEDLKTIEKYRPEALTLMGGEDGKEPIFAIGTTCGSGSLNGFGASFGRESHNADKLATITMAIDCLPDGTDVKEFIADKLGKGITNLNKLEGGLPNVLSEIRAQKAALISQISVAE